MVRGQNIEELTYYSKVEHPIGSLITIPIRKQTRTGLVVACDPVTTDKAALRTASFTLRKLPSQSAAAQVPAELIKTAETLSARYPASLGALLYQLLPSDVRSGDHTLATAPPQMDASPITHSVSTLALSRAERIAEYQLLARETLAHGRSLLLVAPSKVLAERLSQPFLDSLPERTLLLRDTNKRTHTKRLALQQAGKPIVVVTTPAHAYESVLAYGQVIVDDVSHRSYVSNRRPYIDHRTALEAYSQALDVPLLLADTLLPVTIEHHRRSEHYDTRGSSVRRLNLPGSLVLQPHPAPTPTQPYELIHAAVREQIQQTIDNRGRVYVYCPRRGLAPLIMCRDCGHVLQNATTGGVYSLLETTNRAGETVRLVVDSVSGARSTAPDTCPQCRSWRLSERGVGIQQIVDAWSAWFPDSTPIVVDAESTKTVTALKQAIRQYHDTPGSVLIGTKLSLPHMASSDLSVVSSLESARSVPTWEADQELLQLLLTLRECTSGDVLLQTRADYDEDHDAIINIARRGAVEKFYDEELALRSAMQYPPFVTLVLLSWRGASDVVKPAEANIKQILGTLATEFEWYTNPTSTRAHVLRHGLLRITPDQSHADIVRTLQLLPPYVKIEVNPCRIV